jgi:hypothetical protein
MKDGGPQNETIDSPTSDAEPTTRIALALPGSLFTLVAKDSYSASGVWMPSKNTSNRESVLAAS